MESLNEKLRTIEAQLAEAQALAAKYHEWTAACYIGEAIEQVAQARDKTRETAIASADAFIQAAREQTPRGVV